MIMRILVLLVLLQLWGCGSMDAYLVDGEYGLAQEAAWLRQTLPPSQQHPIPADKEGIDAERMMGVQNQTYGDLPSKSSVVNFELIGN